MPFEFVRNDITRVHADAIVNTSNPKPRVGTGVDAAIHRAAGPELLAARRRLGQMEPGEVAVTPAFGLHAKYVIHAVSPIWQDGAHGEPQALRRCYEAALQAALKYGCRSIAFPLLATGNCEFPKPLACQIAVNTCMQFVLEHELLVYLVVLDRASWAVARRIQRRISAQIDESRAEQALRDEYRVVDGAPCIGMSRIRRLPKPLQRLSGWPPAEQEGCQPGPVHRPPPPSVESILSLPDASFSEVLVRLIVQRGESDAEVYKRANVSRKLFSKLRKPGYQPSKRTALALALALKLDLRQTQVFLAKAGYALSRSDPGDAIVIEAITRKRYSVYALNAELLERGHRPLGSTVRDAHPETKHKG